MFHFEFVKKFIPQEKPKEIPVSNVMSDLTKGLLVALVACFLGLAIYIVLQRRQRRQRRQRVDNSPFPLCRQEALVPYGPRSVTRVEIKQPDLFVTEDERAMQEHLRLLSRYIHHPPLDLGTTTMSLEFQCQIGIIVRMQDMYRDGILFFYRLPHERWPRR